ncbi:MAG TPA: hypothetical protein VGX03_18965 [Candidatus Binatia bacterium]|jgi:hypothetical protein|nr:hypothetical protein [Candidatus Binatia bacterium]
MAASGGRAATAETVHRLTHLRGQRVRLGKGRIVGIEELLEDATGHDRGLPLARCG